MSLFYVVYAEDCDLSDEGSLRLVGWIEADAGRVEICHNGEWGTICVDPEDDAWSQKNAEVACRALRYSGARNSIHHKTYDLVTLLEVMYCNS